jgi:hypothetical protein
MVKKQKIGIILLKVIIVGIAWIYVGWKITEYKNTFDSLDVLSFSKTQIFECSIVLLLMLINWSVEAKKWQFSLRSVTTISFQKSFYAILTGTTFGIISPNRAGEPLGRVSHLDSQFRESGVSAGVLCSVGQFTSTILAGCIAFPFFMNQFVYFSNKSIAFGIAIVAFVFTVILYGNVNHLGKVLKKMPIIKRYELFIDHFQQTNLSDLAIILALSIIRYTIFLLQFYLILQVFSVNISFTDSCIAVGMIYLVTTVIPTTTIAELGIRCSSSVYFIGFYCNKPLLIISASMLLWLINVSFPAILGSLFFLNLKRKSKSENEQKK